METPKEKVIKYLNYKGISQDKFSRDCNVSSGFLRQGKSFNLELLKVIRDNYTDLNMNWLIYNDGNMLLNIENAVNEAADTYKIQPLEITALKNELELTKQLLIAKEELIRSLKRELNLPSSNSSSKAS